MKKILSVSVLVGISLMTVGLSYAQLKIPKENIPSDIPANVRKQIERLYSGDPIERGYAAYELGEMGRRAIPAIAFLIRLLEDDFSLEWIWLDTYRCSRNRSSTSPRKEAVLALKKIGKPAVEQLIIALKDIHPYVQINAALILGKIKDRRAVEPLISVLKDNRFTKLQEAAAQALGEIGDGRAIEPLVSILKDGNLLVQGSAIKALIKLTGQKLDQDCAKWQEWWEKNKEKFQKEK